MFFAAEIARLVLLARGDQIPARPAAAQMIERSEFARDMERLVVAGRGGRHEADMRGVGGERREQRQRLEIGDILRRAAQRLHMRLPHAEIVGQKHHVELAALRGAGDVEIMLEIDAGVRLRAGMPPRRHMMAGRIEEGAEPHLAFAGHRYLALTSLRGAKRRSNPGGASGLDCFAEPVIGPATSGRTRWLAMTIVALLRACPAVEERNVAYRLRLRQRLQIGVDIAEVGVREHRRPVWRHLAVGRAYERHERIERQLRARDHLAVAGRDRPLTRKVMALPAAVLGECDPALLRVAIGERSAASHQHDNGGGRTNANESHDHSPQRGCVSTLTSAGWPDLTTATASLIAGPRSAGWVIGPLAHQPMDFARS